METNNVKIQVADGGPLLVNGVCTIVDKDGNETQKEGMTALCRCGRSSKKPYCDGAHRGTNFDK
jgi:CDGSH-type Zn-finger protein